MHTHSLAKSRPTFSYVFSFDTKLKIAQKYKMQMYFEAGLSLNITMPLKTI